MTNTKNISVFLAIAVLALAFALWVMSSTQKVQGSAPMGMRALVASSTFRVAIGPQEAVSVFGASDCVSRVITTNTSNSAWFYFATSSGGLLNGIPTASFGHFQATGTTEVYDSALYGCADMRAFSTASGTITATEFVGFR